MKGRGQHRSGKAAAFELSAADKLTLARMFLDTSREDLQRLSLALQGAELDEVIHRVHRLHGAALTVGASHLVAELESFEKILREGSQIPADSQERLTRLRQALADYPSL